MGLEGLQSRIGYKFRDGALLTEALTHSTYAEEHGCASNQRLEFLGDAVLELCVSGGCSSASAASTRAC